MDKQNDENILDVSQKKGNHKGKQFGAVNCKFLKWKISILDTSTGQTKSGKFTTIAKLNEAMDLKLNGDFVKRSMYNYRTDMSMRNKQNSFLSRYGHIKIEKIFEKNEEKM